VRLHLRVERAGRESTLFLKNFEVAFAVPCSRPHPRLSYEQPKPNSMACNQPTIRLRPANWARVVLVMVRVYPLWEQCKSVRENWGEALPCFRQLTIELKMRYGASGRE
jgi:hypothetical protein